jgi:hypothetical protein
MEFLIPEIPVIETLMRTAVIYGRASAIRLQPA